VPLIKPEVAAQIERLELPFNQYGLDPYGIDKGYLRGFFSFLSRIYRGWLTVNAYGLDNVPDRGRAMVVGNHSGGVALDGGMIIASLMLDKAQPRLAQGMAEIFLNSTPFVSTILSRVGQFTGLPEHAVRLLEDDRLLMVFPEGARGTAKLYPERNSLVGFGTGFIRLALQTGTPIVPTAFIGGGEAIPTFMNLYGLGKLVGAPYVPVTPWVLPLPRPTHCQIYYGPPMTFEGDGSEEDTVIVGYVEQVKARIGQLIEFGVENRRRGDYSRPIPDGSDTFTAIPSNDGGAS
jgi:1-acyl-sn-glycerol-3-phosphate acyltransferase